MMKAKKMPATFWGEAVTTAVFILNRAPTKALKGQTPFEAWHGRKPNVVFMRTFGCVGYVKTTKPGLGKLEDRSTKAVFLGYEEGSKAYRLYDPARGKVMVSRDVVFDEAAAWDWNAEELEAEQGHGLGDTFVVERLVVHGHGEAEQAPTTREAGEGESAAGEAAEPTAAEVEEPPSPSGAGHYSSPGPMADSPLFCTNRGRREHRWWSTLLHRPISTSSWTRSTKGRRFGSGASTMSSATRRCQDWLRACSTTIKHCCS
jgi:hypothetical protein